MYRSRSAVIILGSLLFVVFAFAIATAALVYAAPGEIPAARGERVVPESFNFSALPPATHFGGPIREKERPGLPAELPIIQPPPRAADLTNVTIDPAAPPPDLAPIVGTGFEGIQQTNYIPGEPTVAAGPLNIFTTGNVNVRVVDKDGAFPVETDGAAFFGVPAGEGAISDPVCFYDALRGRFLALAFTQGNNGGSKWSYFYLAISQTNDARGAWWRYRFDQTKDGTASSNNWSDFEGLGISDDKLAMSSQQFSFGGGLYKYQKMRVIDRALAYTGAPVTYFDFYNFPAPPGGDVQNVFVTKPGRNISLGDNTLHVLTTRYAGGSNVAYREITGPPGAPVLSAGTIIPVNTYGGVVDAAQKGSGTKVAAGDSRTPNFYVRNGLLTAAWHFGIDFGSGTVDAIRLFQMRTSDLTVLKDETYGADGVFYYYPACTVDSAGSIFIGFDRSSANEYPSCYVSGRRRADASIEPSVLIRAGLSETSQSRWGDYTGIDMDESLSNPSSSSAWYAGQWTKNPTYFGTWVNKMTFTYGMVTGTVLADCDGSTLTTGDRLPLAGVALALMQGATTLATTTSNDLGYYSFGYLETGTCDVIVTAPAGASALDALPGSGGSSQTRVSAIDLQVDLTNSQTSSSNNFVVTSVQPVPAMTAIDPVSKDAGSASFTMTVTGSAFTGCSVVRLDGSDRITTFVNPNQLLAAIPDSDMVTPGTHQITVFNPLPVGGTSNSQTFTVLGTSAVGEPAGAASRFGLTVSASPSRAPLFVIQSDRPGAQVIDIYDLQGRVTRHLQSGPFAAGGRQVRWDGRNDAGEKVPPGIYFIRLRAAAGRTVAARVVLVN